VSAKIARRTTPAITRNRTLFDFLAGACAAGALALFAGAGVDETEVAPLVGTGGITIFERSFLELAFFALFFAGRFAAAFLGARLLAFLTTLFAAFLAGRFAGAFLTRRFAEAFFFAATITPSL
jgi:hypothetical protein